MEHEHNTVDTHAAIRAYHDHEVALVLSRLSGNRALHDWMLRFILPSGLRWLFPLARPWLHHRLSRRIRGIDTLDELQKRLLAPLMMRMIRYHTNGFSYSSPAPLKQLLPSSTLLLSNHRDITLDPAFCNYALYLNHLSCAHIGVGDNLVKQAFIADLMRLNKSFIVQRSFAHSRDAVRAARQLSVYIRELMQAGHSVWLAHREGRSKDGRDLTDPSIFTMLYLAWRRECDFAIAIRKMRMLALSISYEFDPCDTLKARERYIQEQEGVYRKQPEEDLLSIGRGITGEKGRVHLHFGELPQQDYADAESLARALDRAIALHYRLYPSNFTAWRILYKTQPNYVEQRKSLEQYESPDEQDFHCTKLMQRLYACEPAHRTYFLALYANPVVQKLREYDQRIL